MKYSVKFNGVELNEYIDILQGFTPFSGAYKTAITRKGAVMSKGAEHGYTTYKERSIPMPFTIFGNTQKKYDALQEALNVSGPKELIFEDAEDRVFYAVPSGDLQFYEDGCIGSGVITWLIPDGLAHSVAEKEFVATENKDGVLEVTVVNEGTEAVPVDYTITHNGDNGYIGIVSEYGAIELGNYEEVDGVMKEKSEMLVDISGYNGFDAMITGSGYFVGEYETDGTFMAISDGNMQNWLGMGSAGTGEGWHGAAKTMMIPPDSNGTAAATNFCLQSLQRFEALAVGQLGIMEICITDTEAKPLMSFRRAAYSPERNAYDVILTVGEKEVYRATYSNDTEYAKGAEGEIAAELITSRKLAPIMMKKNGEFFKFRYGVHEHVFVMPDLADKRAYVLSVFIGQRDDYPLVDTMAIQSISFRKDNVDDWNDLPNRYANGAEVRIDGEKTKIYVDNVENAEDEVRGSKYFLVPPGETKIRFYFSSFCENKPTVKAKIREAYL